MSREIEDQIKARIADCVNRGLDKALYNLYWSIRHYPVWAKTSSQDVCPSVQNPVESENDPVGGRHAVSFEHNGCKLAILLESRSSFGDEDGYRSASIALFSPLDTRVMKISLIGRGDFPFDISSIDSFIPGDWCAILLEINRQVREFSSKGQAAYAEKERLSEVEERKRDFGL